MLTLSQAHLSLLDACPREFQYRILDRLSGPIEPEVQARLAWGAMVHRLIEQQSLGLDLGPLLALHPEFRSPLERLGRSIGSGVGVSLGTGFPASPADPDNPERYYSEHPRQLQLGGFALMAVYDGLLLTAERAEIVDWKSYAKPRRSAALIDHWQTRLYLYLLVETSDYRPDQVAMTYWFVGESPGELAHGSGDGDSSGDLAADPATCLRVAYDDRQHQQTQGELQERLARLARWLADYGASPEDGAEDRPDDGASIADRPIRGFDQVADRSRCGTCAFVARCGRDAVPELDWQSLPELDPFDRG
jgi:hypothetical protein